MVPLKSKLIVGAGDFLEIAYEAWKVKEPAMVVEKLEIGQDESHYFDFDFLNHYLPGDTSMFAAFDNRFLNFKRLELLGAIKGRGFQMEPYVSDGAIVGTGTKIGENSFISGGAIIGGQSSLQYNNYVGPRAVVGHASELGHSVWVEAAVVIGTHSKIGAQSILGEGVSVASGIQVGRMCVLDIAGHYRENIPSKTLYKSPFDGPVRIFD
jgi:hypothetical protein